MRGEKLTDKKSSERAIQHKKIVFVPNDKIQNNEINTSFNTL